MDLQSEKFLGRYKSKVVYNKKLVFQSGVGFLIRCILDPAHCPLVAKNDNFDGNKSIFLLQCNVLMLLVHTMRLDSQYVFILPFVPILNGVLCLICKKIYTLSFVLSYCRLLQNVCVQIDINFQKNEFLQNPQFCQKNSSIWTVEFAKPMKMVWITF